MTKSKLHHLCLTCGNIFEAWVDVDEGPYDVKNRYIPCNKCGKKSVVCGLDTLWPTLQHLVKQNQKLRMSVFELECQIEELVDPQGER